MAGWEVRPGFLQQAGIRDPDATANSRTSSTTHGGALCAAGREAHVWRELWTGIPTLGRQRSLGPHVKRRRINFPTVGTRIATACRTAPRVNVGERAGATAWINDCQIPSGFRSVESAQTRDSVHAHALLAA